VKTYRGAEYMSIKNVETKKTVKSREIERSSGNVFADLGVADAAERLLLSCALHI